MAEYRSEILSIENICFDHIRRNALQRISHLNDTQRNQVYKDLEQLKDSWNNKYVENTNFIYILYMSSSGVSFIPCNFEHKNQQYVKQNTFTQRYKIIIFQTPPKTVDRIYKKRILLLLNINKLLIGF
jgi:hypothetical protein